ncbi:MAG: NAD+ synthase [Spirochaetes bacterium]|nr:NAD+ synthase [Spirochaetota bacterium]
MKLFIAQLNPVVGDINGNFGKIMHAARTADAEQADLIITPELCLTGYPPLDLLERTDFLDTSDTFISYLKKELPKDRMTIVGAPFRELIDNETRLFSAAYVFHNGHIVDVIKKTLLPTYDVFDEARYFTTNNEPPRVITLGREKIGITICEDIWNDELFAKTRRYQKNPLAELMKKKPTIVVNISASPWESGKHLYRRDMIVHATKRWKTTLVYVNQTGANDALIFDGRSMIVREGRILWAGPHYEPCLESFDLMHYKKRPPVDVTKTGDLFLALTLGIKDYFAKQGFTKAVIGLSGGIDSALVAVLAVHALGKDNVLGVLMPSEFSSGHSISDAEFLAANLGIQTLVLPIQSPFESMKALLRTQIASSTLPDAMKEKITADDVTEENIQSRVRGMLLMALSNKYGYLMLATGNKSEMSTGYATLYGDLCGALAPLGDVFKTDVYTLSEYVNASYGRCIPDNIITKAPSAELRPNQKDQDTLPPYEILDGILRAYLEEGLPFDDIIEKFNKTTATWVIRTLHQNEYKRRQAPLILKTSKKSLRPGRYFPIVQKYHRHF